MPLFSGPNGGATSPGVTKDEITVAIYLANWGPALEAMLRQAGLLDSDEDIQSTARGFAELFQAHFETYGRKVKLVFVKGSGEANDDAAAKADAIKVASDIKAFMSIGDPTSTAPGGSSAYCEELAARKVICVGLLGVPVEMLLENAPYMLSVLSWNPLLLQVAEYIGKRVWGHPARWAGSADLKAKRRSLGLVYMENPSGTSKQAMDFFERELSRYGAKLDDRVSYTYDYATAQTQSTTIIARLKAKGITSIVLAGEPIIPAFLTRAATEQAYYPEWIITGSGLTDTRAFGRIYDQQQWSHAFGISVLPAAAKLDLRDSYRLYAWHFGKSPKPLNIMEVLYGGIWIAFTSIHMAGPNLTPFTVRDGLFRYPRTGGAHKGMITYWGFSWGHNGLWPWDPDYDLLDDATEIWWDPNAQGPDERNSSGNGMFRHVDGGRRYLPGQWTSGEPRAFDPKGTVTIYTELPPQDRPPSYEHKHYR
ncbi:MAG: hypothetical protein WDA71_07170 [Actinomycetota bacterium]